MKDSLPDDPQDFSFTAGGGLSPAGFQLDDDANATLSNTRTFSDVVPGLRLLDLGNRAQRLGPAERVVQRRQPDLERVAERR